MSFKWFLISSISYKSNRYINKNNQLKALRSIDSIGKKAAKDPLNKLFETAIKEYSNYEYDKAIVIWKEVLKKANNKKDSTIIAN